MDDTTASIVEKVKKLLALSHSDNESEATLALEKAHHLLSSYNLSLADIKMTKTTTSVKQDYFCSVEKENELWKKSLVRAIGEYTYCFIYVEDTVQGQNINLVGKEVNVVSAKIMYEYLLQTIERLASRVMPSYRASFSMGIVSKLSERIQKLKKKESIKCKALVVSDKSLVMHYFADIGLNVSETKVTTPHTIDQGYMAGRKAGEKISLNEQIGGSVEKKKKKQLASV